MSIRNKIGRRYTLALAIITPILCVAGQAYAQESVVRAAMQEQRSSAKSAAQSQQRIDATSNQTTELLGDYRIATQALERARVYNNHLQKLVNDQERIKADLNAEIDGALVVEQEIIPLMLRMIDDLDQFIALDLPFQLDKRKERVSKLRTRMDDANLTVSEKYRQIMEAYQIEAGFGRTTSAFSATLPVEGENREVDVFRLGRLVLAYQTRDKAYTGYWDKSANTWVDAPSEYRNYVTQGLKIARKQAPPDLLRLPIPAPEAGR